MSDTYNNNHSLSWQKQALLVDVNDGASLPQYDYIAASEQLLSTALSLNTGPISEIVVTVSQLHTKTWGNGVQVE